MRSLGTIDPSFKKSSANAPLSEAGNLWFAVGTQHTKKGWEIYQLPQPVRHVRFTPKNGHVQRGGLCFLPMASVLHDVNRKSGSLRTAVTGRNLATEMNPIE